MFCVLPPPGVGDFSVADVGFLPDPCPLPDTQRKRTLNEKERLLYAPMSGVGGVVYDKDAVYIDLPKGHVDREQVNAFLFFRPHMPTPYWYWTAVRLSSDQVAGCESPSALIIAPQRLLLCAARGGVWLHSCFLVRLLP